MRGGGGCLHEPELALFELHAGPELVPRHAPLWGSRSTGNTQLTTPSTQSPTPGPYITSPEEDDDDDSDDEHDGVGVGPVANYEQLRRDNIRRNEAKLAELGFGPPPAPPRRPARARRPPAKPAAPRRTSGRPPKPTERYAALRGAGVQDEQLNSRWTTHQDELLKAFTQTAVDTWSQGRPDLSWVHFRPPARRTPTVFNELLQQASTGGSWGLAWP